MQEYVKGTERDPGLSTVGRETLADIMPTATTKCTTGHPDCGVLQSFIASTQILPYQNF